MNSQRKDIHFQVPTELFNQFYKYFPAQGEGKIFLTSCIKEGIKQRHLKNVLASEVVGRVLGEEE